MLVGLIRSWYLQIRSDVQTSLAQFLSYNQWFTAWLCNKLIDLAHRHRYTHTQTRPHSWKVVNWCDYKPIVPLLHSYHIYCYSLASVRINESEHLRHVSHSQLILRNFSNMTNWFRVVWRDRLTSFLLLSNYLITEYKFSCLKVFNNYSIKLAIFKNVEESWMSLTISVMLLLVSFVYLAETLKPYHTWANSHRRGQRWFITITAFRSRPRFNVAYPHKYFQV